ncbi:hypothetical protein Pmani_004430 [Petrolisthes manimaculis]|uniref:Uncharacterized protein n=1 Tax=Petrolisthes manimaculis TaxID=1843537 RepID=A0AAE1QGW7_9EUCA|nr:hypothetical protein Pmani_004430 [Petrolisthes manimaculis]
MKQSERKKACGRSKRRVGRVRGGVGDGWKAWGGVRLINQGVPIQDALGLSVLVFKVIASTSSTHPPTHLPTQHPLPPPTQPLPTQPPLPPLPPPSHPHSLHFLHPAATSSTHPPTQLATLSSTHTFIPLPPPTLSSTHTFIPLHSYIHCLMEH